MSIAHFMNRDGENRKVDFADSTKFKHIRTRTAEASLPYQKTICLQLTVLLMIVNVWWILDCDAIQESPSGETDRMEVSFELILCDRMRIGTVKIQWLLFRILRDDCGWRFAIG
jgi:hypothetical protein